MSRYLEVTTWSPRITYVEVSAELDDPTDLVQAVLRRHGHTEASHRYLAATPEGGPDLHSPDGVTLLPGHAVRLPTCDERVDVDGEAWATNGHGAYRDDHWRELPGATQWVRWPGLRPSFTERIRHARTARAEPMRMSARVVTVHGKPARVLGTETGLAAWVSAALVHPGIEGCEFSGLVEDSRVQLVVVRCKGEVVAVLAPLGAP